MRVLAMIAAVAALALSAAPARADVVLTFNIAGLSGFSAIPQAYGDRVTALTPGGERITVVKRLIEKRVGAAIAVTCFDDLTPLHPGAARLGACPTPRSTTTS